MREYEILTFIQDKASSGDPIKDAADVVTGILKQEDITPLKVNSMGRRTMGYPIRKQREGQLVISHCKVEPKAVPNLVRQFKLNNNVLTSMITQKGPDVPPLKKPEARPVRKPSRGRTTGHRPRSSYASKP